MGKAKSRLKTSSTEKKPRKPQQSSKISSVFKKHFRHLPLLILSLFFYLGVYLILTRVHPSYIKHFLLPNTYLPLQLALFGGNFFFFSFLLLNTRRGLEASLLLALILFFRLQQIDNYLPLVGTSSALLLASEVIVTFIKHK